MRLLELAVQGVRGFSPSARFAFLPSYHGLQGPAELPPPLIGLYLSLAYPDGRGAEASFLAPGVKLGRAGLSFEADDGQVWRLVRELGGAGALHRMNAQTNKYEVVTSESAEVAQVLRGTVGLPAREAYGDLYTFTIAQLPSKHRKGKSSASGVRSSPSGFGQKVIPQLSPEELAEAKARVAVLEKEVATVKELAEYQFRVDGAQSEVYKVETALKAYEDLKAKVAEARNQLATAPSPQTLGLPDDIVQRVRTFNADKKRIDQGLRKLADEREQAGVADRVIVQPLQKDTRFLGAAFVGVALLIAGASLKGLGHYVAVLAIPAFSFAALLALRFIEELQYASREGAKSGVFEGREKKLKEELAALVRVVEGAMEKVNATTGDEFAEILARRETMVPAVQQLEAELAQMEADPATAGLASELEHFKAEYEELHERLTQMGGGGYLRDAREIQNELEELKEAIAAADKQADAPPPAQPTVPFTAVPVESAEQFEDPFPTLLGLAGDLFAADPVSLWSVLRERSLQYFTAFTDRRYHDVDVGKSGAATVAAPGRTIAAGELPGKDLDLLYLSMRLTIIEKWTGQQKLPVMMEDVFGALVDPGKHPLIGRMLKHLGAMTQVLQVAGKSQKLYSDDVQSV